MKNLKDIQIISFFADEFINSCDHLREGLSADELSDLKLNLLWFMVKAVKAEVLGLGIEPPNKITVTPQDITKRTQQLVEFEKANDFQHMNDRAQKEFRKAINGTYKSWIV